MVTCEGTYTISAPNEVNDAADDDVGKGSDDDDGDGEVEVRPIFLQTLHAPIQRVSSSFSGKTGTSTFEDLSGSDRVSSVWMKGIGWEVSAFTLLSENNLSTFSSLEAFPWVVWGSLSCLMFNNSWKLFSAAKDTSAFLHRAESSMCSNNRAQALMKSPKGEVTNYFLK